MGSLFTVSFSRSPLPVLGCLRSPSANIGKVARRPALSMERRSLRSAGPILDSNSPATQSKLSGHDRMGVRPRLKGLPWASDIRRATGKPAAETTVLCLCDIRMTIFSMLCRRCLNGLRPPKTIPHVRDSPASGRSRRKMPGFARSRSGYRTSSETCRLASGRMPLDALAINPKRAELTRPGPSLPYLFQ
jgi:hypothetical protein